jgi:hypothetical protein
MPCIRRLEQPEKGQDDKHIVARKPQTREEWLEMPLEFPDQTESEQVRRYLSAILFAISRHRKQVLKYNHCSRNYMVARIHCVF